MTKIEYEGICKQLVEPFRKFIEKEKADLTKDAFTMAEDDFQTQKIKYKYLDELLSTFENALNNEYKETDNV